MGLVAWGDWWVSGEIWIWLLVGSGVVVIRGSLTFRSLLLFELWFGACGRGCVVRWDHGDSVVVIDDSFEFGFGCS